MALALNRRFLLQKQLLLSICYLIWRIIKQKRAKRKRTKSMWLVDHCFWNVEVKDCLTL